LADGRARAREWRSPSRSNGLPNGFELGAHTLFSRGAWDRGGLLGLRAGRNRQAARFRLARTEGDEANEGGHEKLVHVGGIGDEGEEERRNVRIVSFFAAENGGIFFP